jgi:heparan-alpha-glucosaminide N-acetyltransferase
MIETILHHSIWIFDSVPFFFSGDPVNKSLYTFSYMLITSASAGITYSALYLLVSSQKQVYHFYFRNMDSDENIGFALYYR